jgi:hypothetical protein
VLDCCEDSEGEEGVFVSKTSVLDCCEEILKEKTVGINMSPPPPPPLPSSFKFRIDYLEPPSPF